MIHYEYLFDHISLWTYATSHDVEWQNYCGGTVQSLAEKELILSKKEKSLS